MLSGPYGNWELQVEKRKKERKRGGVVLMYCAICEAGRAERWPKGGSSHTGTTVI